MSTNASGEKERTWSCTSCTFGNGASLSVCDICCEIDPASLDTEAAWNCASCTFVNGASVSVCEVCGEINPFHIIAEEETFAPTNITATGTGRVEVLSSIPIASVSSPPPPPSARITNNPTPSLYSPPPSENNASAPRVANSVEALDINSVNASGENQKRLGMCLNKTDFTDMPDPNDYEQIYIGVGAAINVRVESYSEFYSVAEYQSLPEFLDHTKKCLVVIIDPKAHPDVSDYDLRNLCDRDNLAMKKLHYVAVRSYFDDVMASKLEEFLGQKTVINKKNLWVCNFVDTRLNPVINEVHHLPPAPYRDFEQELTRQFGKSKVGVTDRMCAIQVDWLFATISSKNNNYLQKMFYQWQGFGNPQFLKSYEYRYKYCYFPREEKYYAKWKLANRKYMINFVTDDFIDESDESSLSSSSQPEKIATASTEAGITNLGGGASTSSTTTTATISPLSSSSSPSSSSSSSSPSGSP